jgi:hypothetical protein
VPKGLLYEVKNLEVKQKEENNYGYNKHEKIA